MPVAPAAGQLRYTRLPISDGEIAEYPTAFFLVEELSASRFIIARPWNICKTAKDYILVRINDGKSGTLIVTEYVKIR